MIVWPYGGGYRNGSAAMPLYWGDRLAHPNKRIHREVKEGEMTPAQAAALHKKDHQIRREERIMASQNGGHITRQAQRTLNQQENAVSREIGR